MGLWELLWWCLSYLHKLPNAALRVLLEYPRFFTLLGTLFALVAGYVAYRVHKRLEAPLQPPASLRASTHPAGMRNSHLHHPVPGSPFLHHHSSHGLAPGSPPMLHELPHSSAASPVASSLVAASSHGGDHALGGGKAYGDELLQDRRLRHRYRRLKQNWLESGQAFFSKIRSRKQGADRWTRRLEDGLESIYSPMELPVPSAFTRETSREHVALDGVRLSPDGYQAFMAIMNSWKVFGGRDVPLLLRMCQGVEETELQAGDSLFEEGKPLDKCLYILKDGELEVSIRSETAPTGPPDLLERLTHPWTIVSGILDFVALLTGSPVADYCASARCLQNCKVLRVPVAGPPPLPAAALSPALSVSEDGGAAGEEEKLEKEKDATEGSDGYGDGEKAAGGAGLGDRRSSPSAQVARCRLIRSCLIRSHRVTLSTAYAYLGVIYDLYPRHPVFPVTGSALTSGGLGPETLTLTHRHQSALKRLVRMVLALSPDYEIQDLEHHLVPPSPRASPAPGFPPQTTGTGSRPVSPPQQQQGGLGDGSLSRCPTTAGGAWAQPRLYLLRKGDSPHELDEQSRTSIHVIVTGRLAVARVEAGSEVAAGGGRSGVGGGPGVGKSIFSDFTTPTTGTPMPMSAGGSEAAGSAPATPKRPSPVVGDGIAGSASPFLQPPPTPTPRMTSAALRGEHGPGVVLGYSCLLTGAPEDWYAPRGKRRALLRLEAQTESWVLQIPHAFVDQAIKRNPFPTLALAARKTLETIPRVLRVIDFGVKWKQLQAGEVLVREGQPSDGCLYVLLHGRARSSIREPTAAAAAAAAQPEQQQPVDNRQQEGQEEEEVVVVADHGRGTLIGETEVLTGGRHKATVQAVRYTSFATLPSSVLGLLIRRHPRVLATLAEHVVEKAAYGSGRSGLGGGNRTAYGAAGQRRRRWTGEASAGLDVGVGVAGASGAAVASGAGSTTSPAGRAVIGDAGAKTILVLPASFSVPLDHFCRTLEAAMVKARHSVRTVTSALAASVLGLDKLDNVSWQQGMDALLLESWLTQQEEQHEIVLYEADWDPDSKWNQMAAGMADVVLLVANAKDPPQILYLEQQLDAAIHNAQKLLILLHMNPGPYYTPSGTRLWIEKRQGINQHYHVRMHTQSAHFDQHHVRSDFARLGRILTGTAVGLVLGGGGARGMAHLGLLRVLEEEGIPVDMIVGTSVGAFVGGLYAKHASYLEILPYASRFAQNMSNTWNFLKDLTVLPFTSYFNGYSFGRELEKAFGDTKIEDCWLSFGCVTVDLSVSQERLHQNGTLWRYVRASMTLAGFLPPLCDVDPKDDAVHYLVDGGYVNNLPADVLKEVFQAETVLACDIGADVKLTGRQDYGDTLTGLQILLNMLPWSKTLQAPSMSEISSQLMYVRSVEQLERAKELIDCYLRPPVTQFGIMDWKRSPEVQSLGYLYARERVRAWREAQKKKGGGSVLGGHSALSFRVGDMVRGRSLTALDEFVSS